jgi:hypothetical protein
VEAPPLYHYPDQLPLSHCHGLLPCEYHHLESVDESGTQVWSELSLADEYVLSDVTAAVAPPEPEDL